VPEAGKAVIRYLFESTSNIDDENVGTTATRASGFHNYALLSGDGQLPGSVSHSVVIK
jgi:hypothetical protein